MRHLFILAQNSLAERFVWNLALGIGVELTFVHTAHCQRLGFLLVIPMGEFLLDRIYALHEDPLDLDWLENGIVELIVELPIRLKMDEVGYLLILLYLVICCFSLATSLLYLTASLKTG